MNDQQRNHDPERIERSLRVWLTDGRPPLADRDARITDVLDSLDDAVFARLNDVD